MSEEEEDIEETKGALPELTKKLISLGLGAYFLTEEKIVGKWRDAKLPKDIGSSISSNANWVREELMSFITSEVARVIKKVDIQEEFQKALRQHKIKVNAEIQFIPLTEEEQQARATGEKTVTETDEAGGGKTIKVETTIVPSDLKESPSSEG